MGISDLKYLTASTLNIWFQFLNVYLKASLSPVPYEKKGCKKGNEETWKLKTFKEHVGSLPLYQLSLPSYKGIEFAILILLIN